MMEWIKHIDLVLFKYIHLGMANTFFDMLMPLLRIPYVWAPVYLFLLVWMWKKFRYQGLLWCAFFFITFVFCDYLSAGILKKWVQRVRPCNDESLELLIRHIVQCGRGFSFPSTHAANHFGLSFFMIFTLGKRYRYLSACVISWALLIGFAQIYVGVHYPFDIVCGALFGIFIAKLTSLYFHTKATLS